MTLTSTVDQARLLAVSTPHSGDWLHALPLSGCGLRLDDKAIHIAVGLVTAQSVRSAQNVRQREMSDKTARNVRRNRTFAADNESRQ